MPRQNAREPVIPARDDATEFGQLRRGEWFVHCLRQLDVDVAGRDVADLGAGYGTISLALASAGARVVSVDVNEERLAQVASRAERVGVDVRTVRANLLDPLPIQAASDVALLVGVVEYAGLWDEAGRVEDLQVRVLRAAAGALRPGGTLVLGTKNRLWPGFAVRDVHTRRPLVAHLPRRLADRLSHALGDGAYRHHIHSPGGWRRLLRLAGFTDVRTLVPYFSYQFPAGVVAAPRLRDGRWLRERVAALDDAEADAVLGRAAPLKVALMAAGHAVGIPVSHSVIFVARR